MVPRDNLELEGERRANFRRMAKRLVQILDSEKRAAQERYDVLNLITEPTKR